MDLECSELVTRHPQLKIWHCSISEEVLDTIVAPGDYVSHPWYEQVVEVPVRSNLAMVQIHCGFLNVANPFYHEMFDAAT